MKDKTALALIEQAVMLLVFLLAAALCLRAFAWADSASRHREAADRALTQAQSAAEQIKHRKGDLEAAAASWGGSVDGRGWVITFDEAWTQTENGGCFFLRATFRIREIPCWERQR